ncbi:MAG: hypothetical protein ACNA70_09870, partial [Brevefilum sp.]
ADGLNQLKLGINRGDAGDPFPGSTTNRTFNYSSTPNSRLYSGADSLAAVTNISNCATTMTANLTYSGVSVPAAPTGVAASDGIYTEKVRVSWTASSGATYYQVFRNTSSSHSGETTLTSSIGSSPYDDTSAAPGQTYYYWVKACNSAGCSGYSAYNTGYRAVSIPSAPTGVAATDGTYHDKVRVSWNTSSGATSYRVYRNTSGSSPGEGDLHATPTGSPYDDYDVVFGQLYYYWVKACNTAGCSVLSAVATVQLGVASSLDIYLPLIIKGDVSSPPSGGIVNGGFEQGSVGWTQYSSNGWELITYYGAGFPHSGSWAAWLGGDDDETSRISQTVNIPVSQPYLHFWY